MAECGAVSPAGSGSVLLPSEEVSTGHPHPHTPNANKSAFP